MRELNETETKIIDWLTFVVEEHDGAAKTRRNPARIAEAEAHAVACREIIKSIEGGFYLRFRQ